VDNYTASGTNWGGSIGPTLYYSLNEIWYINSGAMFGILRFPLNEGEYGEGDRIYPIRMYSIGVPVYMGFNIPFGSSAFSLFGQAGPHFDWYWFSADEGWEVDTEGFGFNPLQAGLGIMAGINIKRFKFELGYKYNITNFISHGDIYENWNGYDELVAYAVTSKLSSIFLGISYVF
jgi:hypothetical protein